MGIFISPEAAAFAYDLAASALHGEFAAINFKLADRTIQALGFGALQNLPTRALEK